MASSFPIKCVKYCRPASSIHCLSTLMYATCCSGITTTSSIPRIAKSFEVHSSVSTTCGKGNTREDKYLGCAKPKLTSSHSIAIPANTLQPSAVFCNIRSCPPKVPPKKAPKNWLLAFIPIAVALDWIGATFDNQDGNNAYMTLKAIKKIPSPASNTYFDS